jgi:hypothetical protein
MFTQNAKTLFTFRWRPNRDLVAVVISWLLVVSALYTATLIVGLCYILRRSITPS